MGYAYDGDRLRVRKDENGQTTYYVRSSVLGGQVTAEVNAAGQWVRGHVYLGSAALAVQEDGAVSWVHEDPVTKTKKRTNASGTVTSSTLVDPWGGEVTGAWVQNPSQQKRKFTTYERGADDRDEAQHRGYSAWLSRFDQPDPYDGSYDLTNPQSLNRYAYTQNDPVNFVDPSGLLLAPFITSFCRNGDCRSSLRWDSISGFGGSGLDPFDSADPGGSLVGGGGGQQPSQPQTNKDCYAFADEVTRLLNSWPAIKLGDVTEVANELWRRFANSETEFGSDGFRTEFADHGGSANQARHYAGGFMAATVSMFVSGPIDDATGTAARLGAAAANAARETNYVNINPLGFPIPFPLPPTKNQQVDRALNKAAAAHAHLVGNSKTAPRKLGDLIKKTICAPRP